MFYGEFVHSIDSKGRLIIPAKFRDTLRENYIDKFFVTRGLEHCLFVFTPREWNLLVSKLKEQPLTKVKARDFMRLFLAGACEVECDGQGRIMIPQGLLRWAGIKKDVVVVGVLSRFEIWDEENWRTFERERGSNYEEIAEQLIDVGL
ncbi:MAG: division/cell wall cluster transcriptional repressor MraZ [Candidatus Aureabacteria bacterium]|nr:division/cell wall cluster transcriptional repressor MraZ [Candidatus Auribacterota bacterium]